MVKEATGTTPTASAQAFLTTQLGYQLGGCSGGAGVVPQQRRPHDGSVFPKGYQAVLLGGDADCRHVCNSSGRVERGSKGGLPDRRVDFRPGRMRCAAMTHQGSAVRVADDDLTGLG
jgi:hypothetical protein